MYELREDVNQLTDSEVRSQLRKAGIRFNYAWSHGGGRTDPNRDHTVWTVEFEGSTPNGEGFEKRQVRLHANTGSCDGKARCEREAKQLANREILNSHLENNVIGNWPEHCARMCLQEKDMKLDYND